MKRIHDEKSINRNLKNIRLDFAIENLLIIALLGWQILRGANWYKVTSMSNPLYAVLIITALVLIVLSVNVSAPMEHKAKTTWTTLIVRFVIEIVIFSAIFFFLIEGNHFIVSLISGTAIALVLLGLNLYANHFRQK